MSANLELVKSIYAAFKRGDYSSSEWTHPEIEFVIVEGPTPGSRTGVSVFHLRDGKVTRLVHYFDQRRALADLGLPSESGSSDSIH